MLITVIIETIFSVLFWTDWDSKAPRIEKCSMSGDNRTIIVKINELPFGEWPNGLTLDYQLLRVYWIDAMLVFLF